MIDILKTKRNYIMALAVFFVFVSLSGTTYSLFLKSDTTNTFNYNTGILDLEFVEDKQITLESAFPMIDSEGVKAEPYTLTIKNTGTLIYLFDLKMLSSTEENAIDSKYIKVKVNEELPHTLYSTNNIIYSNVIIYPGEEKTFKINIWLDNSTPNIELGKTFTAKIVTTGTSIYKTLDSSGANHPQLEENMIPVYYDENSKNWKKADRSNTIENYGWYNYSDKKWANVVTIKNTDKQIYDITRNNNLKVDNLKINNGNIVIEENYLDIGLSNYSYNKISNILRIKIDDLKENKINIISNNKISYYYDNQTKKFSFTNGSQTVNSQTINLEEDRWYIIGYTYNGNKVNFYLDGTKIGSSNINGTINSSSTFKLGSNYNQEEISSITVGDLYIYNDILSENEINSNYKTSINPIYENLLCGYNEFTPMNLKEYYLSNPLGSTINKDDISIHYVWIPRFKYKLWNVTGETNIDSYDAMNKGIDIVFENGTTTSGVVYCQNNNCYSDSLMITKATRNDNNKYYTHPAFKNLDEEVSGLWVSKYEISTSNEVCNDENPSGCLNNDLTIESKSNNTTWRNNYLSNFYQTIKKIDPNKNYHMIKNTEWGAISYLAYSKYGLCTNNSCSKIEPNQTYIQGNNIKDSTTNNKYGVFDMGGSATEFVMANYANENKEISLNNSHFSNIAISNNDYDLYYENSFILGDATKELTIENGIWHNNISNYIDETNNWFIRGGIKNNEGSGIFYYNATTDIASDYISTRIVLK